MTTSHATATFTAGDTTFTIGKMKSVKAARVLGELRALSKEAPQISDRIAEFTRDYEEKNARHLTELQARLEFPPRPLFAEGAPVLDTAGGLVYRQSPLDALPEDAWDNGALKLPVPPSEFEIGLATLDIAVEVAERRVYRLVALMSLSNDEVVEAWEESDEAFDEVVDQRVKLLMRELFIDELVDVALAAFEAFEAQLRERPDLGRRLGKIVAANPWMAKWMPWLSKSSEPTTPEASSPTGSTPSQDATGGTPEPSTTPTSPSSSTSGSDSTATTASDETPSGKPATEADSTSPQETAPAAK